MALNLNQQIQEAINRSRQILITFRQNGDGDAIAASLALAQVLQKQGKQVEITCDSFVTPAQLKFLHSIQNVKPQLSPLQKFIIKVDVTKNKLETLSYDVKDGFLYIYITPRGGLINRADVQTAATDLKFDLIIILDSPDLASLGKIYENNTELFVRTPTINIDHNPANEHFGKINLVEISTSSTCEIVFELLSQIEAEYLDTEIATFLLTGMIVKTRSFKTPSTNSRTLDNAGKLVEMGARREEIVQNLYRNRTLSTLKLWGQALAHLKNNNQLGLVSLNLTKHDFLNSGATPDDLPEIIDELIVNAPEAKIIVLLYETNQAVEGIVSVNRGLDAQALVKPFNPEGTKERVKISIKNKDLVTAEKEVIENIVKIMQQITIHNG
ncbi:MAG: DHH family phosphoesterase [Patescibacteria group bacterium]